MSFGCLYFSGIQLFSVAFHILYNGLTEVICVAMSIKQQFIHFKWLKGEIPPTIITCKLRNTLLSNSMRVVLAGR